MSTPKEIAAFQKFMGRVHSAESKDPPRLMLLACRPSPPHPAAIDGVLIGSFDQLMEHAFNDLTFQGFGPAQDKYLTDLFSTKPADEAKT